MAFRRPNLHAKDQEWVETLKCCVCLEVFQDPRLLPCHHSFCLHCLQDLASRSSSFFCPQCRFKVNVPPGGLSHFQRNFYLRPEELEAAREIADGHDNVDQSGTARSSSQQDDLSAETSTESHRAEDSSTDDDWLMAFNLTQQEMANSSSNSITSNDPDSWEDPFLLPGQLSAEAEEEQEEDEDLRRAIQESLQSAQSDAPREQAGQEAGQERRVPGLRNLQKTVASEAVQKWNQRRQQTGEPSRNQPPRPQPLSAGPSNTPTERRELQQIVRLPTKAEEEEEKEEEEKEEGGELQRALLKRVLSTPGHAPPREQPGQPGQPGQQPGQQAGQEAREQEDRGMQETVASEAVQEWSQRQQAGEPSKPQRGPRPQPLPKNAPALRTKLEEIFKRPKSLPSARRHVPGLPRPGPGQEQGEEEQEQKRHQPVVPLRPVHPQVREGQGEGQQQTEQDQISELKNNPIFKRILSRR